MTITPEIHERIKEFWNEKQSLLETTTDQDDKKALEQSIYVEIHEKIMDEFGENIPWIQIMQRVQPRPLTPTPNKDNSSTTVELGETIIPIGRTKKGTKQIGIMVSEDIATDELFQTLLTASIPQKEAVGIVKQFRNTDGTPENLKTILSDSAAANWSQQKGIIRQMYDDQVVEDLFGKKEPLASSTDLRAVKQNLKEELEYHQLLSMKESIMGKKNQDFNPMQFMAMKAIMDSDSKKGNVDPIQMMLTAKQIASETKQDSNVQLTVLQEMIKSQRDQNKQTQDQMFSIQKELYDERMKRLEEKESQYMSPEQQMDYTYQQIEKFKGLGLIPRSNPVTVGMSDTEAGVQLKKAEMTKDMTERVVDTLERRLGSMEGLFERGLSALITMARENQTPPKKKRLRTPEEEYEDEEDEVDQEKESYHRIMDNIRIHGQEAIVKKAVNRSVFAKNAFQEILGQD